MRVAAIDPATAAHQKGLSRRATVIGSFELGRGCGALDDRHRHKGKWGWEYCVASVGEAGHDLSSFLLVMNRMFRIGALLFASDIVNIGRNRAKNIELQQLIIEKQ